ILPRSPTAAAVPYMTLFRSLGVLGDQAGAAPAALGRGAVHTELALLLAGDGRLRAGQPGQGVQQRALAGAGGAEQQHPLAGVDRSEEHTSELQSRENLVCRL